MGRSGRNKHHLYIQQIRSTVGKELIFLLWSSDLEQFTPPPILYEAKTLPRFKSTFKQLCCKFVFAFVWFLLLVTVTICCACMLLSFLLFFFFVYIVCSCWALLKNIS